MKMKIRPPLLKNENILDEVSVEKNASNLVAALKDTFGLTENLTNKIFVPGSFFFLREKNRRYLHDIHGASLNGNDTNIDITYDLKEQGYYSIEGEFTVKLKIYSDYDTEEGYNDLFTNRVDEIRYAETIYIFNANTMTKLIQTPKSIQDERTSLLQHPLINVYPSKISQEDINFLEKSLAKMIQKIISYKKSN